MNPSTWYRIAGFSCLLILFCLQAKASNRIDAMPVDTSKSKPYTFIGLPAAFFTPETDWGFGGLASVAFRFRNESADSRPSQVQLGAAYTLNKQYLLFLPFQLFIKNEEIKLYGELGYFLYTYNFFGIGNDKSNEVREVYEVLFPRLRLNALRLLQPNVYVGLRYWMDDFDIQELDPAGELIKGQLRGYDGGFLSGLGLILNFDDRDNIFYTSQGKFAELILFHNGATFGSDFDFSKVVLDASVFFKTHKEQVLAFNWYSELTFGNAPFNQLALLGGPKKMRGNFEGRYRDNHMLTFQGEYRAPLFWRVGAVAFAGLGRVAPRINDFGFDEIQYSLGVGLRFMLDTKEKLNLRVDYGFGKKESGFYFTFGEAF